MGREWGSGWPQLSQQLLRAGLLSAPLHLGGPSLGGNGHGKGVGEWMATAFLAVAPHGPTFGTFAFLRSLAEWEWGREGSGGVDGHNFWSSCSARAYFRHLYIFEVPR